MRSRLANSKGFTLIEILVVLALTVIVMTLIFQPLIQSLKITRSAEIIIRVQDNARFALAQVSHDLSNAMYVYDSSEDWVYFPINVGPGVTPLINPGNPAVTPRVYYTKIDMVLPRCRGFCPRDPMHTPGGMDLDSPLRESVPKCPAVLPPNGTVCGEELELRPIQPLTTDRKIVRYFIGLKRPWESYFNGNNQVLAEAGDDNTFILYRVEFDPMDQTLFPEKFPNGVLRTADDNRQDPNFFYNPVYAQEWRNRSKPIVTLEDIDLITIERGLSTNNPIVTPTVTFKPTAIYNDPLVPTTSGESNPTMAEVPPRTYKASYGNWVLPYKITLEPEAIPNQPVPNYTFVARQGMNLYGTGPSAADSDRTMCIYKMDSAGVPMSLALNITQYTETRKTSDNDAGDMGLSAFSDRERAFTVDTVRGLVNCAFPNVAFGSPFASGVGQSVAVSDVFGSDYLNDSVNNPECRLILNYLRPSGSDPRVLPNATVVPGSVKIIAPDARPNVVLTKAGAWPLVQYSLTPYFIRDPGPNQFSVDYQYNLDWTGNTVLPNQQTTAAVYFNKPRSLSGSTATGVPPGTNNVLVYYEVQNNKKGDILRASYTTKSVITVRMGIRIFDPGAKKHQTVQFTNKVRLKNVAQ